MGLLSFITGAGKAADTIDKVGEGLVKGVDMLFFTEEEKAIYSANAGELWLKTQGVLAAENTARTLTRRYISVAVIYNWLLMNLVTFFVAVFLALAQKGIEVALSLFTTINTVMGTVVLAIIVFYFGPSALGRIIETAKK